MLPVILTFASGLAWAYAYVHILHASRKDNALGIHPAAAALNISWEVLYFTGGILAWGTLSLRGQTAEAFNGVWLILDLAICIQVLRRLPMSRYQRLARPAIFFAILVLCALMFQASFLLSMEHKEAATFSAFLQNALMSASFYSLVLSQGMRGQRISIAVAKFAGTLCATASMGLFPTASPSILVLGVLSAALDVGYIVVLRSGATKPLLPLEGTPA